MRDDDPEIIVCQGPPRCDLTGEEAVEAQAAGCPWCKRIIINRLSGEERIEEPASA